MDLKKIAGTITAVIVAGVVAINVVSTPEERVLSDRTEQAQDETVRFAVVPVGVYEWAWSIDSVLVIRYPNYLDKDSTLVEFDMNGNVPFPDWLIDTVKVYNWMTKEDFRLVHNKAYRSGVRGDKINRISRVEAEIER